MPPAKVLVAASSKTRANVLAASLRFIKRGVHTIVGAARPKSWDSYRLAVFEPGPHLGNVEELLDQLNPLAHVVMIFPTLDVKHVAQWIVDPRVNYLLGRPTAIESLRHIADKLATGSIFGLDRYLPDAGSIVYRRISTFEERCDAIDTVNDFAAKKRLRSSMRRAATQVLEELLMNAMYQAPFEEGRRVFADISPKARVRRKTPRPVSLRFGCHDRTLFLSVRDRYGSFLREDLVDYLLRCTTQEVQIENKELGAGLGLYVIVSSVSRFVINLVPGGVAEFICVFDPPNEASGLSLFSFTAQRPLNALRESDEVA